MLQLLSNVINWFGNGKIVLLCQKLNSCSILLQCHVMHTVALVFLVHFPMYSILSLEIHVILNIEDKTM